MKNHYFKVITIVIGLIYPGTMGNPSRKTRIFFDSEYQWKENLLANCSSVKHDTPVDGSQSAATVDVSFHFLSILSQSHVRKEEWKIKHLNLSNDLLWKMTSCPLTHLHTLEVLDLSNNAICSISLHLLKTHSSQQKYHRWSFQNGLPFLKVLLLQRNKPSDTPKGKYSFKRWMSQRNKYSEKLLYVNKNSRFVFSFKEAAGIRAGQIQQKGVLLVSLEVIIHGINSECNLISL
jgi:hypothetical protein